MLAEANAYYDKDHILPQHEGLLYLLQRNLNNPGIDIYKWLDLGCGRGQILSNLKTKISPPIRRKLNYYGYDMNGDNIDFLTKIVEELELGDKGFIKEDLSDIENFVNEEERFDLITLINTMHEINPIDIPKILYNAFIRLKPNGLLFIYDMEKCQRDKWELGALTWATDEIKQIMKVFYNEIVENFLPEVSKYEHSVDTWHISISRDHFKISDGEVAIKKDRIISRTHEKVCELIERKYEDIKTQLGIWTDKGVQTPAEAGKKIPSLYDFWALTYIKDKIK